MNNRYTFKGKTKQGKWVYGNLLEPKRMYSFNGIDRSDKFCLIVEGSFANGGWVTVGTKHWVLKETLCQCTGLQDVDDNYIFENDIVNIHNNPYHGEAVIKHGIYKTKSFKKGQTEVEHLGFYLEIGNELLPLAYIFTPFKSLLESTKSIKIIGNKFDKEVE